MPPSRRTKSDPSHRMKPDPSQPQISSIFTESRLKRANRSSARDLNGDLKGKELKPVTEAKAEVTEAKTKVKPVKETEIDPKKTAYSIYLAELNRNDIAEPVHAKNDDIPTKILKRFDLSTKYGPCDGLSRLERWNRASNMGLSPPEIVKEILMTDQGRKNTTYSQCLYYQSI